MAATLDDPGARIGNVAEGHRSAHRHRQDLGAGYGHLHVGLPSGNLPSTSRIRHRPAHRGRSGLQASATNPGSSGNWLNAGSAMGARTAEEVERQRRSATRHRRAAWRHSHRQRMDPPSRSALGSGIHCGPVRLAPAVPGLRGDTAHVAGSCSARRQRLPRHPGRGPFKRSVRADARTDSGSTVIKEAPSSLPN